MITATDRLVILIVTLLAELSPSSLTRANNLTGPPVPPSVFITPTVSIVSVIIKQLLL